MSNSYLILFYIEGLKTFKRGNFTARYNFEISDIDLLSLIKLQDNLENRGHN